MYPRLGKVRSTKLYQLRLKFSMGSRRQDGVQILPEQNHAAALRALWLQLDPDKERL
jgi:hypothetical protein